MSDDRIPTVRLFDLDFSNLSVDEISLLCERSIATRTPRMILTPNVAMLVQWRHDPFIQEAYRRADVVSIDGRALHYAARLLGQKTKGSASGSLLFWRFISLAERHGHGVYLLGARADVVEEAVERLRERHPSLRIVGSHHGYFSGAEAPAIAEEIRLAAPEFVFLGMSSPAKEKFMLQFSETIGVPVMLGVGGMFDIAAGRIRQAPHLVSVLCLEWLWRLAQEPRRLWRRYLVSNSVFASLLVRGLVARAKAPWASEPIRVGRTRGRHE